MPKRVYWIGCVCLLVGLLSVCGGCGKKLITGKYARSHPSPELQTLAHTKELRKNMHARTHDTNLRQILDDLDAILLIERPVQLSKYPVP